MANQLTTEYIQVYPARNVHLRLERVLVAGAMRARGALCSYRATVCDATTGERVFSLERWGARTAILVATARARRMGLTITVGEDVK